MEIFIKERDQEVQGKEETRTEETLFRLIFELVQMNMLKVFCTPILCFLHFNSLLNTVQIINLQSS